MKYWSFIDEEKILEELLANPNTIAKDISTKVKILIKHYKREGLSKNEIRNELDNFLMEHFVGFVLADWDKKLKRWVNKYTKQEHCSFIKMNDIVIYKEELDFISKEWNIEGENNIEIEKLLFVREISTPLRVTLLIVLPSFAVTVTVTVSPIIAPRVVSSFPALSFKDTLAPSDSTFTGIYSLRYISVRKSHSER